LEKSWQRKNVKLLEGTTIGLEEKKEGGFAFEGEKKSVARNPWVGGKRGG